MLHVFSTNRVKLAARKPKATDNLGYMSRQLWTCGGAVID